MLPDSEDLRFLCTKLSVPQPRAKPSKYLMNEMKVWHRGQQRRGVIGRRPHPNEPRRPALPARTECPTLSLKLHPLSTPSPLQYACQVPGPGTFGFLSGILFQPLLHLVVYT